MLYPYTRCQCCVCNHIHCMLPHKGHNHQLEPSMQDVVMKVLTDAAKKQKQDETEEETHG